MWNIEVVRTYKTVGVYECEDKVIFEVNSLDEARIRHGIRSITK